MDHFLDTQKEVLKVQLSKLLMLVGRMKPYQIKMKLEMDIDLRIVGFNYGSKGTRMSL
jgi:hypothetical protein